MRCYVKIATFAIVNQDFIQKVTTKPSTVSLLKVCAAIWANKQLKLIMEVKIYYLWIRHKKQVNRTITSLWLQLQSVCGASQNAQKTKGADGGLRKEVRGETPSTVVPESVLFSTPNFPCRYLEAVLWGN